MTIAFVSGVFIGSPDKNDVTSASIDTTGANFIVVVSGDDTGTQAITDNKSNGNPTGLTARNQFGAAYNRIWYWTNPIVGTGHTFTIAGGGTHPVCMATMAFSGVDTSIPFDNENGTGYFAGTAQPGSLTPSANNELQITGVTCQDLSETFAIDSGFTIQESGPGIINGSFALAAAYIIQTTATAKNPTWTLGVSSLGGVTIASFQAGAAASGSPFGFITDMQNQQQIYQTVG